MNLAVSLPAARQHRAGYNPRRVPRFNLRTDIAVGIDQQFLGANSTCTWLTPSIWRTAVSTLRAQAAQSIPSTCQL
ncbi:hypothetical protein UA44_25560 [Klebsiella aerogenes]|nr:hypothetical protein UA44_25560 [Klebsiella aerogenes]